MVDTIVVEWHHWVFGDKVARLGMGKDISTFLVIFCADDGYIAARFPKRLQSSIDTLVGLSERIRL